jgi:hypothetical protein
VDNAKIYGVSLKMLKYRIIDINHIFTYEGVLMNVQYAPAGSKKWLQIAVNRAHSLLDNALRQTEAIGPLDTVEWKSPLKSDGFTEYRDTAALRLINADPLPKLTLAEFWPPRGPAWDALGVSSVGTRILVEAKAHIPEAASPPRRSAM